MICPGEECWANRELPLLEPPLFSPEGQRPWMGSGASSPPSPDPAQSFAVYFRGLLTLPPAPLPYTPPMFLGFACCAWDLVERGYWSGEGKSEVMVTPAFLTSLLCSSIPPHPLFQLQYLPLCPWQHDLMAGTVLACTCAVISSACFSIQSRLRVVSFTLHTTLWIWNLLKRLISLFRDLLKSCHISSSAPQRPSFLVQVA